MSGPIRPSAQYEITMRLEYPHEPGGIARISGCIADLGGAIQAIDLVHVHRGRSLRDYSVECRSTAHAEQIVEAIKGLEGLQVQSVSDTRAGPRQHRPEGRHAGHGGQGGPVSGTRGRAQALRIDHTA